MAATTAGALKAYIESLGLGLAVRRDHADTPTYPLVTVHEGVSIVTDASGDFGDMAQPVTVTEQAQVDLWQQWKNTSGAVVESYTLPGELIGALHGAQLSAAPTKVYGCRVVGSVRLLERDENVVHHAITVEIHRVI